MYLKYIKLESVDFDFKLSPKTSIEHRASHYFGGSVHRMPIFDFNFVDFP